MKRQQLNIKDYTKNAAKYFSYKKLIIFIIVSLLLTILLAISIFKSEYEGVGLIFSTIVLALIFGYTILNIVALITKIKK